MLKQACSTNLNQLECSNSRRKSTSKKVSNTAAKIASKIGSWNPTNPSPPTGWCWLRPAKTPKKTNMTNGKSRFWIGDTSSNGWFSILSWLVFRALKKKTASDPLHPRVDPVHPSLQFLHWRSPHSQSLSPANPPPIKKNTGSSKHKIFQHTKQQPALRKKEMHQAKPRLENIRIFHDFLTLPDDSIWVFYFSQLPFCSSAVRRFFHSFFASAEHRLLCGSSNSSQIFSENGRSESQVSQGSLAQWPNVTWIPTKRSPTGNFQPASPCQFTPWGREGAFCRGPRGAPKSVFLQVGYVQPHVAGPCHFVVGHKLRKLKVPIL